MEIPDRSHKIWENIINDKIQCDFEFLATKVLLTRIKLNLKLDNSPGMMEKYIKELYEIFSKNATLPKVQNDLKKMRMAGGI